MYAHCRKVEKFGGNFKTLNTLKILFIDNFFLRVYVKNQFFGQPGSQ